MLCQTCTDIHKNLSITRNHKIHEISKLTYQNLLDNQCKEICSCGKANPSELFCCMHTTSICYVCAATLHKKCQDVIPLENKLSEDREKLGKIIETLKGKNSKLSIGIEKMNDTLGQIDKDLNCTFADLDLAMTDIQTELNKWVNGYKQFIKASCEASKKEIASLRSNLMFTKGSISNLQNVAERMHNIQLISSITSVIDIMNIRKEQHNSIGELEEKITTAANSVVKRDVSHVFATLKEQLQRMKFENERDFAVINKSSAFVFHEKCGMNVALMNEGKTLIRKESTCSAAVANEPMATNTLYQVLS